jgi:hypothetical protein
MEVVRRAPAVREKEQPEGDLRDQEGLAGGENVCVDTARVALAEQVRDAPAAGEQVREDEQYGVRLVQAEHARDTSFLTLGAMLKEGKPAPDFELASDGGEPVRLSDLRGHPVVLYFYPADDSHLII